MEAVAPSVVFVRPWHGVLGRLRHPGADSNVPSAANGDTTHKGSLTMAEERTGQGHVESTPAKSRRNARVTRQAILESARQAFTRSGYDGAGVREIAQNAGVTAMLVNRYFGSKEKLFEEAVEATLSMPGILRNEITKADNDISRLCQSLAVELAETTASGKSPLDAILLLIRSAANPQAAAILRESAQRHMRPLVDILPGSDAPERAAMFLAVVAGFELMRYVIALPALAEVESADMTRQLRTIFESLLQDR